jgi:hypothetical protein
VHHPGVVGLVVVAVVDGTSRDDDPEADGGHTIKGHHGAHS